MKIYLIGVGMGNPDTLTLAARKAIDACPVLIGAPRLLEINPRVWGTFRLLQRSQKALETVGGP